MMQFTCLQGIHLGLEQYFLLDSRPHFLSVPNTSLSGRNGTSTTIPKFKAPLCTSILNVLLHTWLSFKHYHVLINYLSGIIWCTWRKAFVKMGRQWSSFATFINPWLEKYKLGRMSLNLVPVIAFLYPLFQCTAHIPNNLW